MKNVFITGVSGYIGQKIARALAEDDKVAALVGIDIREPNGSIEKLTFVRHDVREPVADLLKEHDIDTAVHAAYVLPPLHNKDLMEAINISGTKNILAACSEAAISHLLYTSSATAYGFHADNPVPGCQACASDAAGRATHGADFGLRETHELSGVGRDRDLLVAIGQPDRNELIILIKADRADAVRSRPRIVHQGRFLDGPLCGREQNIGPLGEFTDRQ